MDEKTLKRANTLTSEIQWLNDVIKDLENRESTIRVSLYIGSKNLGADKKVKAPLIRLFKRRLTKAQREFESL